MASLRLPEPTSPLVPRAPWMRDGDPRSDADADAAWQSSSSILLPSTIASAVTPLPGPDPVQGPRNLHPYLRSNYYTNIFQRPLIPTTGFLIQTRMLVYLSSAATAARL